MLSGFNLADHLPVEAFLSHRRRVIIVFALAVILSLALMPFVNVNYDMREYLPDDSKTVESLQLLEQTFGIEGSAYIMVPAEDLPQVFAYKEVIKKVDGVAQVIFADDLLDFKQPLSWHDQNVINTYLKDNKALFTVSFTEDDYSDLTRQALVEIRESIDAEIAMAGPAVRTANMTSSVGRELFWIMAVVIPLFLIILLLFTHSYTEAILFLIVIGAAVVINIGTNSIFNHISFMTHLSVAVLQFAISMDYSIFLLHRFGEERQNEPDLAKAMIKAVRGSFAPITASAATTIAGFMALTGMRYSLGRDMGLVLSKGILFSLICVLFLLPVMTLTFIKSIDKTTHRNLLPSFRKTSPAIIKSRFILVPIWIIIMIAAFWAQSNNSFIYGESAIMSSKGSQVDIDQNLIEDTFGRQNPLLVIIPSGLPGTESLLIDELAQIPVVNSIQSLASMTDPALPRQLLPKQATEQMEAGDYSRIIMTLDTLEEGEQAFAVVDQIREITLKHFSEAVIFGSTTSVADIKDVVEHDYSLVNLLSILAVGLILLITFRNFLLPIVLVLIIESAIWLNMSIPFIAGNSLSFIGYMIISAVQLGATIDYAILLTSRFIERRKNTESLAAGKQAIGLAGGSVLMSAGILTVAGLVVWIVSNIEGIQELGLLIGRGAIMSGFMVLIILPQLLVLLDKVIYKADFAAYLNRKKEVRQHVENK